MRGRDPTGCNEAATRVTIRSRIDNDDKKRRSASALASAHADDRGVLYCTC